jgi:hypothetical protein
MVDFARVKWILDNAITTWQNDPNNENPADLSGHGASFSWATREALLAAVGHGVKLIQVKGKGQGSKANLVIDLRTGINGQNRMPRGGPFVPEPQIKEIEDWIEADCLP